MTCMILSEEFYWHIKIWSNAGNGIMRGITDIVHRKVAQIVAGKGDFFQV